MNEQNSLGTSKFKIEQRQTNYYRTKITLFLFKGKTIKILQFFEN